MYRNHSVFAKIGALIESMVSCHIHIHIFIYIYIYYVYHAWLFIYLFNSYIYIYTYPNNPMIWSCVGFNHLLFPDVSRDPKDVQNGRPSISQVLRRATCHHEDFLTSWCWWHLREKSTINHPFALCLFFGKLLICGFNHPLFWYFFTGKYKNIKPNDWKIGAEPWFSDVLKGSFATLRPELASEFSQSSHPVELEGQRTPSTANESFRNTQGLGRTFCRFEAADLIDSRTACPCRQKDASLSPSLNSSITRGAVAFEQRCWRSVHSLPAVVVPDPHSQLFANWCQGWWHANWECTPLRFQDRIATRIIPSRIICSLPRWPWRALICPSQEVTMKHIVEVDSEIVLVGFPQARRGVHRHAHNGPGTESLGTWA